MDTVTNLKTQEWINALRSGQYTQTRGCLHNSTDGGFCCLGVAEFVIWNTTFVPNPDSDNQDHLGLWDEGDQEYKQILAYDHQLELGLGADDNDHLADLNDHHSFTFNQIADVLAEADRRQVSIQQAAWDLYPDMLPNTWEPTLEDLI